MDPCLPYLVPRRASDGCRRVETERCPWGCETVVRGPGRHEAGTTTVPSTVIRAEADIENRGSGGPIARRASQSLSELRSA
jgi:hypothetical protein